MIEITRYQATPVEGLILSRGDNGQRRLRGLASVYYDGREGTQYELTPSIVERIAPGAFDGLLSSDVIAAVDHNPSNVVGRTPDTLRLFATARGLEYEIDLPNTSIANDLWENVTRGIVKGSSFRARLDIADKDSVEWQRDGKRDVMLIKRFSALRDVAPTATPAYSATELAAVQRSLTDWNLWQQTQIRIAKLKSYKV